MRACVKCNKEFERKSCEHCAREKTRAWKLANPERAKESAAAWRNANKDKVAEYNARYKAEHGEELASKMRDYKLVNPGAIKKACALYYASHKEKINSYSKQYRASNPHLTRVYNQNRRSRLAEDGGRLSSGLAEKLFKLQKGKCACCGESLGDDYHLDHIMPIALGGSNTNDNIQLLRASCNLQKNCRHPVEFMQYRGFLL